MSHFQMFELSSYALDFARAHQKELLRQYREANTAQGLPLARLHFRAAFQLRRLIYKVAPRMAYRTAL